ncbi:MAG: ABC transporter permease [Candidatus Rokuibacteriota bacterium]
MSAGASAAVVPAARHRRRVWGQLLRNPTGIAGTLLIGAFVVLAVFADVLAPHDPLRVDLRARLRPPGVQYPFGTDDLGRDLLSRVIHGTRVSLTAGVVVVAIAGSFGVVVGTVSGYVGGAFDEIAMRLGDMFLAFPTLVLGMAVVAALGPGLLNAMIAVGVVWWPGYARLVRGIVLSAKHVAYVEAARAGGAGRARVMVRHILPGCVGPLIVKATIDYGFAILVTAGLSFIGLGAQAPTPEWGAMVAAGRLFLIDQWWYATFPGLFIFVTVLAFGLFGDAVRDAVDPRLRI